MVAMTTSVRPAPRWHDRVMTRWQIWRMYAHFGAGGQWTVDWGDGAVRPLDEVLGQLGGEGWEVVSESIAVTQGFLRGTYLMFKRLIEE